jgi:hypothetical protein
VTLEEIQPGSLKVVAATAEHALASAIGELGIDGHCVAAGTWVIYTAMEPASIRDALAPRMPAGQLFVAEFERWSVAGDAIDPAWLLRRGH